MQNFIKSSYFIKKGEQARENTQEYKFILEDFLQIQTSF